jgi:hypothetical protein
MPISKKSKLFKGFKHQDVDGRIHITPQRRNIFKSVAQKRKKYVNPN